MVHALAADLSQVANDEANPALDTCQEFGPNGPHGLAADQRDTLPFAGLMALDLGLTA